MLIWLCSALIVAHGSSLWPAGSSLGCMGFSLIAMLQMARAQLLWYTALGASRHVGACFSASPAMAGGFSTAGLPGKSPRGLFKGKRQAGKLRDVTSETEAGGVQLLFLRWKEEGCEPSNAGSSRCWKKSPLEVPGERQSC